MAVDPDRWTRLVFHLLDEALTYGGNELEAERTAVLLFTAIHERLDGDPKGALSQ